MAKDISKTRSFYDIPLTCAPETASQIVSQWMGANHFTATNKKGEDFFISKDMVQGNKAFKCWITGNILHIEAWIPALGGMPLDDKYTGSLPKAAYKELLSHLFTALQQAGAASPIAPAAQAAQAPVAQAPAAQTFAAPAMQAPAAQGGTMNYAQSFQDSANKQNETMAEVAFWFSIVSLLLPIASIASGSVAFVGIIIYLMGYLMAAKGLHTRKRGKAIAAIVMYTVSLVLVLLAFLISLYL